MMDETLLKAAVEWDFPSEIRKDFFRKDPSISSLSQLNSTLLRNKESNVFRKFLFS